MPNRSCSEVQGTVEATPDGEPSINRRLANMKHEEVQYVRPMSQLGGVSDAESARIHENPLATECLARTWRILLANQCGYHDN